MKNKIIKDNDLVLLYDNHFQNFPGRLIFFGKVLIKLLQPVKMAHVILKIFKETPSTTHINGNCLKFYCNSWGQLV